ncbi:chorion protein S36 [Musca domestica]|uniref:Chorion protein S36 n=1 Tax=Musca domestica TaxID=7370 RepID=A0A1I8MVL3_MUSDO|nr:chorion protein S36 [Musca domestica]
MNFRFVFTICAIALPIVTAYGPAGGYGAGSNGVEELINAAAANQQGGAASLTATADVSAPASAQAGLAAANAQLAALQANSAYNNLKNSDAIAESLAENVLASNIRQGLVNVVAPNVVGQTAFRSLLVPNRLNTHHVIATQPLQPLVVNQPGSPVTQVNSGPPSVVRAAPIIYKLKPSVIYQQEVINKVPTPLSLNPVYVKVYKPGKHVDAPVAAPSYGPSYGSGSSYGGSSSAGSAAGSDAGYGGAAGYNSAPAYSAPAASYGGQSAY